MELERERELLGRYVDDLNEFIIYVYGETTKCLITTCFGDYNMYDITISNRTLSKSELKHELSLDLLNKVKNMVKEEHQIK